MKYFGELFNNFIGKLSEELCWEIVQQFMSERPMNCFRELSNKFTSEDCLTYLYRRVAHKLIKQIFLFGNDFHT